MVLNPKRCYYMCLGKNSNNVKFVFHDQCLKNSNKISRKTRIRVQTSKERADSQSRLQVIREMLPIHYHAWTWLSIVTLECIQDSCRELSMKKSVSAQKIQEN